jgi:hypothetical protein
VPFNAPRVYLDIPACVRFKDLLRLLDSSDGVLDITFQWGLSEIVAENRVQGDQQAKEGSAENDPQ